MRLSPGLCRPRLVALLLWCAFLWLGGQWLASPAARAAQDEGDKPAATADTAPAPEPAAPPKPKLLKHIIESAGPIFGPLLLVISIALVTVIVLLAMDLRMATSIPPAFVEEFTETVNKRKFKEAYDLARNDSSFLARVLTAGMGRLQYGLEDAREAAVNMVESIKAGKEQLIAYLATAGTLGPMIGLVGTVFGMIQSFMVLAEPGKTPKPEELAKGISHALVVTLLGIGLSVPAIFCHAFFRNRLIRISLDTSNMADDLLTQMYHNSRKPGATEPPRAQPAPPAAPVTTAAKTAP
jgi:biopolymer transport protein ExbB